MDACLPPERASRVIATLRAHETELRHAGIRGLSLFGSTARGDEGPASDIDLAADLDPSFHIGLFALSALQRRLATLIGLPVDLLPEPVEKPRLQARIEQDRLRVF